VHDRLIGPILVLREGQLTGRVPQPYLGYGSAMSITIATPRTLILGPSERRGTQSRDIDY
jgi:hypothetical protein